MNAVEFLEYMAAIKGLDSATAKKRIDELLLLVNKGQTIPEALLHELEGTL